MPRQRVRAVFRPEDVHERQALDDLFTAAYEDLRRRASKQIRHGDARFTLSPTGLVNETWFKLSRSPALASKSRLEFLAIAAHAMRQVLIEAARRRGAQRRAGGAGVLLVALDDQPVDGRSATFEGLLALDEALDELERLDPRQARLVEQRFFAGLTVPELAQLVGVSEATVKRDLKVAQAWLKLRLGGRGRAAEEGPEP